MHRTTLLSLSILAATAALARADSVDLPRNPSISPDGSEVCFSWRGDLWRVPVEGGLALRLTAHPASELRSAWSPDGQRIAFNSRRDGALNVWSVNRAGGDLRQHSASDVGLVLGQFHPQGGSILVHGRLEGDVYKASRPYLLSERGGDPKRLFDAFGHDAVVSPDGRWAAAARPRG